MSKAITVTMWVGLVSLVLSLASCGAFSLIGSHVNENGMVVEPFALLPIGGLLFIVAVGCALANVILRIVVKSKAKKENE